MTLSRMPRHLALGVVVVLAALTGGWPQGARAQFPPQPGLEQYFQIPDITLPPNPTLGQVLYSHELPQATPTCSGSPCSFPFHPEFFGESFHVADHGGLLVPRHDAPVGLRVTEIHRNQVVTQAGVTYLSNSVARPLKFKIELVYRGGWGRPSLALSKIGHVTTGGGPGGGSINHSLNIGFNINAPTCNYSSPILALRPITQGALSQIGATSAIETVQLIATCSGTGGRAFFTATFLDRNSLSSRSDVLSPGPGSTSQGVQLQLMVGNQPLFMGQEYGNFGGVPAYLDDGVNYFTFGGRYIRTGRVEVGSITSQAIMLVNYL